MPVSVPDVPSMMKLRQILLALSILPLLLLGACSSTSTGDTVMKRPDYYYLDPSVRVDSPDDMVRFESRHHMYGAITNEERRQREGHYYSFPWSTSDTSSDAALLFEYRQANTGADVHSLRVPIERVRRKNVTRVAINGEPFQTNGKVTAWRATIERNGEPAATKRSYLWE